MKKIILFALILVSGFSFGQSFNAGPSKLEYTSSIKTIAQNPLPSLKILTDEERKSILRVEEEYDTSYFALYIQIQTSQVTDDLLKYTQKVAKFGQKNRMTVYIGIQSGKPGNGCPPGGCH